MYPPKGETNLGNFIAWDPIAGKIVWSDPEPFRCAAPWPQPASFYGTLEGYLKAVDAKTGQLLWKFKTPSGIIGNINTYVHGGSNMSPCCPVSADGPGSAWRPA
jgi:glucose dehydrogenase